MVYRRKNTTGSSQALKQVPEIIRQGRHDLGPGLQARVVEANGSGVEQVTLWKVARRGAFSVALIADNGKAIGGEVDADLVLAPGMRHAGQQGVSVETLNHA